MNQNHEPGERIYFFPDSLSNSPDACVRQPYPERKICGFEHFWIPFPQWIWIPSDACGRANSIWIRYLWTGKFLNPERKSCGFKRYPDSCGRGLIHACMFSYEWIEQDKGSNLLSIITWSVLGKQNVKAKKVFIYIKQVVKNETKRRDLPRM